MFFTIPSVILGKIRIYIGTYIYIYTIYLLDLINIAFEYRWYLTLQQQQKLTQSLTNRTLFLIQLNVYMYNNIHLHTS